MAFAFIVNYHIRYFPDYLIEFDVMTKVNCRKSQMTSLPSPLKGRSQLA